MGSLSSVVSSGKVELTFILIFQAILIIIYGIHTEYDEAADASIPGIKKAMDVEYPMFQDVHVMIFIGFGFLMTFLKKYGYSAVGFNLLLAALMIQWAILCRGLFLSHGGKVKIGMKSLMGADIAAASVLISMGALLGQTTYLQLLVMGIIEVVVFAANEYLIVDVFELADVGGSIVVHTFGAYFGLSVCFMLRPKKSEGLEAHELEGASYNSDIFAMIGTVFLWIFWPSFNGGLVSGDEQYRAIINTYLSLAACTVTAFTISALTSSEKKFDMVHVQNSTLAGGVAVGSICNMMIHPFGAMLAGSTAGIISVCGYKYLTPRITAKLRLRDTCGVHNLHGMPGIFSGILAAIIAFMANKENYNESLYSVFPAMSPIDEEASNHTERAMPVTSEQQAGYQLLGLVVTLAIAIVTGLVTGILLKTSIVGPLPEKDKYNDEFSWELPECHEESHEGGNHSDNQPVLMASNEIPLKENV